MFEQLKENLDFKSSKFPGLYAIALEKKENSNVPMIHFNIKALSLKSHYKEILKVIYMFFQYP